MTVGPVTHVWVYTSSVHSLAENFICYGGEMEGLNALIAAIKEMPNLSTLKCASSLVHPNTPRLAGLCDSGPYHTFMLTSPLFLGDTPHYSVAAIASESQLSRVRAPPEPCRAVPTLSWSHVPATSQTLPSCVTAIIAAS